MHKGSTVLVAMTVIAGMVLSIDIVNVNLMSLVDPESPKGAPYSSLRSTVSMIARVLQKVAESIKLLDGNSTAAAEQSIDALRALIRHADTIEHAASPGSRLVHLPGFAAPRKLRQGVGSVEFAQLASTLERAVNNDIRRLSVLQENGTYVRNTADKLVYQLVNFAPLHHRFASVQWNDISMEQRRRNGLPPRSFVLALSSVNRATNYLLETITNLVSHMSDSERKTVKIVLLNAEWPPERHLEVPAVRQKFRSMIDEGTIEIIELPHEHPQLKFALARRWGDSLPRIQWRSKQALDVAFLLDYVQQNEAEFRYVVVMEDDIVSSVNFVSCIRRWVDANLRTKTTWTAASFYNPWDDVSDGDELPPYKFFGVIGQLFRLHDLPVIVEFLRKNFDQSPLDWLFVDILKKFNGSMTVHTPSLFQHRGKVSSFAGKEQDGASVNFVEVC